MLQSVSRQDEVIFCCNLKKILKRLQNDYDMVTGKEILKIISNNLKIKKLY